MTFNLCVLLYSKYSSTSKKLTEYIKLSQIDFTSSIGLQTLCVDNEEIRKKIIRNTSISITCVPCLLLIYKDGGVEKYEGSNLFNWFEDVVKQFTQSNTKENQLQQEDKYIEQKQLEEDKDIDEKQLEEQNRKLFEENKKKYEQKYTKDSNSDKEIKRRPIEKSKAKQSKLVTRLEELHTEDESDDDRYKNKKPIKEIQEYEELEVRKPPVKNANANQQKSSDIMNKAKELAKGRESDTPTPPPGYPVNMKI
jgi:hypothetical protein